MGIIYYVSMIILIPGLLFSLIAQARVNWVYSHYSKKHAESGWVACDMAQMLLEKSDCVGTTVAQVPGKLSDNYNPTNQVVSLSETVYSSSSISALGVAAHEVGHAIQHNQNYAPFRFRSFMVKVVNFGSALSVPIAIIGVILSFFAQVQSISEFVIFVGIILYSLTAVFSLITLPVELNASRRAKKLLVSNEVLTKSEVKGVSKVLNAAAWTYVAALAVSLLYLLRFIIIIASLTRHRD